MYKCSKCATLTTSVRCAISHWWYFHHRKQSHPKAGPLGQGQFTNVLDSHTDRGSLWSQKRYLSVNPAHHINKAWRENILRCHLAVTWCTSAFVRGIRAGGVILVFTGSALPQPNRLSLDEIAWFCLGYCKIYIFYHVTI